MKILLPIIILFLLFSCKEKDKNALVSPPKDTTSLVIQRSFKIVCDTVPAFFLNTEDGTLTTKNEVVCDTIYDN